MKTQVIAEIGINHNGDIDITKKLIDISVIAGCDVVKFQKRNPDVCVPEHQKSVVRKTPWGEMTYLEYKHKIEFDKDEYDENLVEQSREEKRRKLYITHTLKGEKRNKKNEHYDNEMLPIISGPWMNRWPITNHNVHTEYWNESQKNKK